MVNVETALELVSAVAPPRPSPLPSKMGYVKIRLTFLTSEPKHIRSIMLRDQYKAEPPYLEDIYILLPLVDTFSILETFIPTFEKLRKAGVVAKTSNLLKFKILDEDSHTLSYLF